MGDDQRAPSAFVRESTGLVKNVSFLDSIFLNLSNMSIGGSSADSGSICSQPDSCSPT